jgi:predicted house-cleaning noncanonical NTP pyrophosphatase (MazG superfamily)
MTDEKLIRDKIADFVLKERGETLNTRIASQEELLGFIKNKVLEEANEVVEAKNVEELAEEIGDLLEVIKALAINQDIVDLVFSKREAKFLERGGFENGVILVGGCKK